MNRSLFSCLAFTFVFSLLCGFSHTSTADSDLDLIFTADLAGDWVAQDCADPQPHPGAGLAMTARAITQAKEDSLRSLVIGGGSLLGPGSVARFLLGSDSGSEQAARLLHEAGIQVFSPGVSEFSIAKTTLFTYFDTLKSYGSPPILSNAECTIKQPHLCEHIVPFQILPLSGMTVGILATIPEDAAQHMGPDHLAGAKILPLHSILVKAKELRSQVDILVVEMDSNSKLTLWDAVGLARALDAHAAHPDVIHVTQLADVHGGVKELTLDNGTLLIGTPAHGTGVTKVSFERKADDAGRIRPFTTTVKFVTEPGAENLPLQQSLEQIRNQMCQAWSLEVATLPSQGLDRKMLTQVVLDTMREKAKAEIALINSGAIAEQGLPLLRASNDAVGNALPFKAQVIRATVQGQDIIDGLKKYANQEPEQKLRMSGLTLKDDNLFVNGRPILPAARYRVVTIDFLAAGGNGLLPEKFLDTDRKLVAEDLRGLVLAHMKQQKTISGVIKPLKLDDRPLWTTGFDLGIDLQNVMVTNPNGVYDRPQLTRTPSVAYKIDGSARVEMDLPKHLAQFTFRGQYGQSWLFTNTVATDPNSEKAWTGSDTANLINALLLYSFRGFSVTHPRLPTPYASLGLESEFHRPDNRDYTHLELSAAVGLRVALPAQISANLGIGVRSELLADPNSIIDLERDLARPRFLLTVGLEMPKRALVPKWGNALLAEFLLSYNFTDPTILQTQELRLFGKLYIALKRPLYFTIGTDFYLYRFLDHDPGFSWDLTVGLKVLFDVRNQMF